MVCTLPQHSIVLILKNRYKLHTSVGYKRRRKFPRCHHELSGMPFGKASIFQRCERGPAELVSSEIT